jgi:mono/diheme cytochrome c family protein
MRNRQTLPFALALSVILTLGCGHTHVPLPGVPQAVSRDTASAERGETIVRSIAVCGGCHSAEAKNPDGALTGGKEFRDWRIGVTRASNLTPDPETGLGSWSEAEIVRAIRNGERKDGRLLAPVMPYEWFHEMSDDDAFAVARYLKSLPAVRNEVKQNPNFIFKLGKLLFLKPKPASSISAPPHGASAEYGGYLAQHVGLCGECHTPRTGLLQKPDRGHLFAGVKNPPKDFPEKPSNLTPDPDTGIGKWTEDDFVRALRTGKDPSGDEINPFMPWPALKRMSDDDLHAMYRYLKGLTPIHNQVETPSEHR